MTLYELAGDYLALMEMADDPELDPEVFADTMEGISGALEDKAEGYAKVIKTLQAEADGLKAEMDRMRAKKQTIENNIDRMKKSLEATMIATDKRKFKTALFSFAIQKNAPSVQLTADVPDEWNVIKKEPDKKKISAALKDGAVLDFAELVQSESIRIR